FSHRAANERDELAPRHSITSSARASSSGGLSSPSAFAVREYTERAAYLARFQTASTTTPCPIDATGLVYREFVPRERERSFLISPVKIWKRAAPHVSESLLSVAGECRQRRIIHSTG